MKVTIDEIIDLIEDMRFHQKRYFKTKNKAALLKSKELEKRVDDLIDRFRYGSQESLF